MVQTAFILCSRAAALAHPVQLRDGTLIGVRPIRLDDGERLQRFHARLSPESVCLRYFHVMPFLSDALVANFTRIDYVDRMALVATVGNDNPEDMAAPDAVTRELTREIVSMANYDRISANCVEVAFVVEDAWQGKGIASTLLYDLAAYARACGFRAFLANMLGRNTRMLDLLKQCGYPCTLHDRGDDEVNVLLDITVAPRCQFAPCAH